MNKFQDLNVWKKVHILVLDIYKITAKFPAIEKFGITDQLKRATVSIAANIVEGNSRQHTKEKVQFIYMAKGSLEEVRYFLLLVKDLAFINEKEYNKLQMQIDECGRLLNGFLNFHKQSKV